MEYRYHRDHFGLEYYIPEQLENRFLYLQERIRERMSIEGKYIESARGHVVMFLGEFSKYEVKFDKGSIWSKRTEDWYGSGDMGILVRIVEVNKDFVRYRKVRKFFLYFSVGSVYTLNKWSFLRIFGKDNEI
jgi:hypothetical protein